MKKLENGNIRTCEVRLSFPELFQPKAIEEGKTKKYSTAILFPKGADMSVLKEEIKAVAEREFPGKPLKSLRIGIRDQGEKDFEGYADGAFFLNASSEKRPPVVDRFRQPIVEEDDVYPGIWAIVTLRVYAFKPSRGQQFAPGIGFGLQAVQVVKDGERLGAGMADPEEEFEVLEGLEEGESADSIFGGATTFDDEIPF
jgi:hypothetical protein